MTYEHWENEFSTGTEYTLGPIKFEVETIKRPYGAGPRLSIIFGGDNLVYKCLSLGNKYWSVTLF